MSVSEDEWICRENLKRLRRQLDEAQDPPERNLLNELIAQERAKLGQFARANRLR
jgi:hypothetical protein